MLTITDRLPSGFADVQATDLHRLLPEPTLIHLMGRREAPLFVSILLHGNETTGLLAAQQLLARYQGQLLPRAMSLLVGNVRAAAQGLRRLDDQPDYNRIWGDETGHAESRLAATVLEEMSTRRVFAAVDVHNNSGDNPTYACINRLDDSFLSLARLFSARVIHFTKPAGVASMAFSTLCPAVTIECGRPGEPAGVQQAADYLDRLLNLDDLPALAVSHGEVLHSAATVKVPDHLSFSFDGSAADLRFPPDFERHNFQWLPAGFVLAQAQPSASLDIVDTEGQAISDQCLAWQDGKLVTKRQLMPAMVTTNRRVVRQDCLCYLMEPVIAT